MLRVWVLFAFAFSLCVAASAALAMSVSPILTDMATAGRDSRSTITVVNTGTTTLPVEIAVNRMDLGENGERNLTPDDEDFLVFPPQAMIPSGASQVFRVQWAGDPDIDRSRSYAFLVNQIPVESDGGGTVLELVYSVVVYVNVSPLQGDSDLTVLGVGQVSDDTGGRKLELVVENRGTRHDYLSRDRIMLKEAGGSWNREIRASEFASTIGIGLVQPGKTRRFVLPVEPPAGVRTVSAEISVDEDR
jgi:P pilus assembly protein, chaperone PapD